MLKRKKEISQEANENKSETRRFPVARKKADTKPNKAKQSNQKRNFIVKYQNERQTPNLTQKIITAFCLKSTQVGQSVLQSVSRSVSYTVG